MPNKILLAPMATKLRAEPTSAIGCGETLYFKTSADCRFSCSFRIKLLRFIFFCTLNNFREGSVLNDTKQPLRDEHKPDPEYWAIFEKTKKEHGLPTAKQNIYRISVLFGICVLFGLVYFQFADFGTLPWNVTDSEVGRARLGFGLMFGSVIAMPVCLIYLLWLWMLSRKVMKETKKRMFEVAMTRVTSKK